MATDEENSNLFSPKHLEIDEQAHQTNKTESTLWTLPFIEVERKLSALSDHQKNISSQKVFLFSKRTDIDEKMKTNLQTFFDWQEKKDFVFQVRKTISLDK